MISIFEKLAINQEQGVNQVSSLRNKDIIPMGPHRRIWDTWSFLFYWGISNICISTWSGATSLLSLGMGVGETMGVIIIGNVIIAVFALLNAAPGGDYHIGFTLCQRFVFGLRGSYLGLVIRIILSIVWFGSQAWLGGLCLGCILSSWSKSYMNMKNTFPDSVNMTKRDCISFLLYQILSYPWLFARPEKINKVLILTSLATFFAMLGMTIWAVKANGGNGSLMSTDSSFTSSSAHGWAWITGISSWYGSLSAGVTNQSDYTRFSAKTWSSLTGTIFSIVVMGTIIPLMGMVTASACEGYYGEAYWMPNDIIMKWLEDDYSAKARAGAFWAALAFLLSQFSFNAIGNGYAGGMDLAGLFPKYINIRRGAFITALLSWVVQPWDFYNTDSTFVTVMGSFSVFMTPIIGLIISEYWIIRRRKLKLSDLYNEDPQGNYWYYKGFNIRTMVIWLVASVPGIPGLAQAANSSISISTGAEHYFEGSCMFGFSVAFGANIIAALFIKPKNPLETDEVDYFDTFTAEECEKLHIISYSSFIQGLRDDDLVSIEVLNEHDDFSSGLSEKATRTQGI